MFVYTAGLPWVSHFRDQTDYTQTSDEGAPLEMRVHV